jgi:hypothetical protein
MKCSRCNVPVPPGSKCLVVMREGDDGPLMLRWNCEHFPLDESDPRIVAVLGAQHCARLWFDDYLLAVRQCSHKAASA